MYENVGKRVSLAKDMIYDLKETYIDLLASSDHIAKDSSSFYSNIYNENKDSIENEIQAYKDNINKINSLNQEVINRINDWYNFTKNQEEFKSIFFPLKFFHKRKELKKKIKNINQDLCSIAIDNRFIKEKIHAWEKELEQKVVQKIMVADDYQKYQKLLENKNMLISELKYLIPTIPGICPIEIELDNLDSVWEKLVKST